MTHDRVGRVQRALGRKEEPMTTPRKKAAPKAVETPREPLRFGDTSHQTATSGTIGYDITTHVSTPVEATLESMSPVPKFSPGEQTTEFWLTGLGVLAATVLAAVGKLDGTAALAAITAAVTGYSVSRGLAKR